MEWILLLVAFAATAGLLVYSQRLVHRIREMEALNRRTGVLNQTAPPTVMAPSPAVVQGDDAQAQFQKFSSQAMDAAMAERYEVIVTKHLAQLVRLGHDDADRGLVQPPSQLTQVATLRGVVSSWLPADLVADVYAIGRETHGSTAQMIQARSRLMTKLVSVWQVWGRRFTPTLLETIAIPLPEQAALSAPEAEAPTVADTVDAVEVPAPEETR